MDYISKFPNLAILFSYFNQDWVSLFLWKNNDPSVDAVVRYFKINHFPDTVEMALKETKQILNLNLSEEKLQEAIDEFSLNCFNPNESSRDFFNRIYKILSEPNTKTENSFVPVSHKLYSPKLGY